ncbi:hypothetical protein ABTN76_19600, partial [Acinetobacter baumannii]
IATFNSEGQPITVVSRPYGPALQPSRVLSGWAGDYRKEESFRKARTAVREAWTKAIPTGEASTGGLPGLTVGYQLSDARGQFLGVVRATLTS